MDSRFPFMRKIPQNLRRKQAGRLLHTTSCGCRIRFLWFVRVLAFHGLLLETVERWSWQSTTSELCPWGAEVPVSLGCLGKCFFGLVCFHIGCSYRFVGAHLIQLSTVLFCFELKLYEPFPYHLRMKGFRQGSGTSGELNFPFSTSVLFPPGVSIILWNSPQGFNKEWQKLDTSWLFITNRFPKKLC